MKIKASGGAALILLSLCVLGAIGWCMNIYQIVNSWDNGLTVKIVFKMIGVFFAPLGALLGWIS